MRHGPRVLRIVCGACLPLLALSTAAIAQSFDLSMGKLAVGVRSEVRPFSYKLPRNTIDSDATRGPLSRAYYGGYVIRICDAVLTEMLVDAPELQGSDIRIYDIDLGKYYDQNQDVEPEPPQHPDTSSGAALRFKYLGEKYDILCDPATITNGRREWTVSPPLFLTGIGYLSIKGQAAPRDCDNPDPSDPDRKDAPKGSTARRTPATGENKSTEDQQTKQKPQPALIGLVEGTTAVNQGLQALVDAKEMPRYEQVLVAYLRDKNNNQCKDGRVLVRSYPTYQQAAEGFCNGQAFHYFVGDLEIIRTYVAAIPGCKFDNGIATYTNDRYGIFGRAIATENGKQSESRKLIVARFFDILAQKVMFNPSILDKAYIDTFPNQQQSRKLKLFYWAIRGERQQETPAAIPSNE